MFPIGTLVWAKQQGSPHWPAIISPNTSGKIKMMKKKTPYHHVLFLAYENQHAWIPKRSITEFTGPNDYKTAGGAVQAAQTASRLQSMAIDDRLNALNAKEGAASTKSRGEEESSDLMDKINRTRSNIKLMRTRVGGSSSWVTANRKRSLSPHDDHDSGDDDTEQDKREKETEQVRREEKTQRGEANHHTESKDANKPDGDIDTVAMASGEESQRKE